MSIASLYPSINPSLLLDFANVKRLDPRITFTRTTTATYYDGVTTAKAEENLVLYSQEFDNSYWTKTDTTITANSATTAPDGTTTADLLYPNSTGTDRTVYRSSVSGLISTVYTFSFYAKASGINWIYVGTFGGGTPPATCAFFDLQNGVVGQTGSFFTSATITSVGNSWYRCIVIGTTAVASIFPLIGLANGNNSSTVTASGTNGVLLWGAQLEQRSSATAYTATTSQAITNYIPVLQTAAAGQARFDHNPTTGESLGLLIEEARTNQCLYSGDYTNAAWQTFNASKETTATVAPNGTLTACKIIATATSANHGTYQQITPSSTGVYATSIYVKAAGYNFACLRTSLDGDTKRYAVVVNLTNGAVTATQTNGATNTSYSVQDVGNGWYRVSVTASQSSSFMYVTVSPSDVSSPSFTNELPLFTGNGFSGIFIWGAQLEAGSFATSYIPTVASSVTRNADAASMTGTNFSSWFNNANMSAYIEAATNAPPASTNTTGFSLNDGTLNRTNFFQSGGGSLSSARAWLFAYNNGATIVSLNSAATAVTQSVMAKSCVAIKTNDFGFSLNSGAVLTDTDGTPVVPTQMNIGADYNASAYLNGTIKKLAYYPIRVTNTQLQSLTV